MTEQVATSLTSTSPADAFAGALRLVLADFREMPGLELTDAQAAKFWAIEPALCSAVLSALVNRGYLVRKQRGLVARAY